MAKHDLQHHRESTRPPAPRPKALTMTGPDQVYSWDISYLRSPVTGVFFYLYMVVDVWSRMIVAAEVHDVELDELAIQMIERACAEGMISSKGSWLHSDNGGPMKSGHMLAALRKLGIKPSFSRPRMSDDNPFSESLFRTLKYRPSYPKSFCSLADARVWVEDFVTWYNTEHLHSGISFVTPSSRHYGEHTALLANRCKVYEAARRRRPDRWSGRCRAWKPHRVVCLNPERDGRKITAAASELRT